MLDTSQIISVVLVFGPLIASLIPLTGMFDLNFKDVKKQFEDMGKDLREKKIENWRKVFVGANADGFNDDYIGVVLRSMSEGDNLYVFLKFCKRFLNFYYISLFIILSFGVIHGFLNVMGWFPSVVLYVSNYNTVIIAGTILYIVFGMGGLLLSKYFLEKKYEKYLEIF